MDCALKYNFSAAEMEANQKSTHSPTITNYSFITRHFTMQGNTLQSTGYLAVSSTFVCRQQSAEYWVPRSEQYICLQTTECRVGQ